MASVRGISRRAVVAAVLGLTVLLGCGEEDEETPAACVAPADTYVDALADAPDPVLLEGSTPISDCLTRDQDPAELGEIGEEMIAAATELNADARRDPAGEATVELGYLIGAAQEGAAQSGGIHADLLRRLDVAARFNEGGEPLPASFERSFGEGYAAGQEAG
ncbi:MAG: hypothetical protein ACRDL3_02590 [Solirubrobacterales bacterium]